MVVFEIGSLLSGVAPSIHFLIFARAFQGVGASGIFIGTIVCSVCNPTSRLACLLSIYQTMLMDV